MVRSFLRRIRRRIRSGPPRGGPEDSPLAACRDLVDDEYVELLSWIIGGYLVPGNIQAIEYCLRHMPEDGAVVEIGTFLGKSTNVISYGLMRYGRQNPFFTCDPWLFADRERPKAGYFSTGTPEYREWVMQLFRMNTSLFSPTHRAHTVEMFSSRFFEEWAAGRMAIDVFGREAQLGGPISFAYVDGDHTHAGVTADYMNIDRFLLPGGLVLFDDSADVGNFEGVKALVAELCGNPGYDVIGANPNYCFRKRN